MATTVGQHGVAAFTNPSNGDALDANVVKGNDNTIRDAYVAHDGDPGIHIQSSLLAARPAAGTVGRKWMTTDTANVKLFYDNGSAWENLDYLPTAGNVAITGDLTVAGTTTLTGTVGLPSGTILTSPSLLGTMTGGTLTPSTINVPSGTTIPTHTETGTITATGSTRNNGTLTGATLNNTTFTGTITGINTTPVAYSATLGPSVALTYLVWVPVLTLSSVPAGTYLITAMTTGLSTSGAGSSLGGYTRCTNTVNGSIAYGMHTVTAGVTSITYSVPITMVVTLASTGNLQLDMFAVGSTGTPYALSGPNGQTFISALKIQ